VQQVVVAEVNGVLEECSRLVFLELVDDLVGLVGEEECDDVVLYRVADLLLVGVAHSD
jgi:hypothetical protein